MTTPLLTTKLYIPSVRPNLVRRPHLVGKLNKGARLGCKLTLISAPAGFGKTTLVSEWVYAMAKASSPVATAWLSLDEGDGELARFLAYLIGAVRQVEGTATTIGQAALGMLHASQPQTPPTDAVLTSLINELAAVPDRIILILDDYHSVGSSAVDGALSFWLEHLPPHVHLVIATREDPNLPLARLRALGQMTELRAADLRFSPSEAAEFLNRVMGLDLSAEDVAALESRTEGWIAGLQLAAVSMQGHKDVASFIRSFTGSHRYVLDYLIEEVLLQQSDNVQAFLLQTAVLDRLTGSLCDAVRFGFTESSSSPERTAVRSGADEESSSQATLESLERANLFIVPLDEERRWYRYHQLFSDLLRQRLRQELPERVSTLHVRASEWYEHNGFAEEAIEHALRAEDFERAADMIEGYVDDIWQLGENTSLRRWLDRLPVEVVYSKPHLCILHAGNLFTAGEIDEAERRLEAAELALDPGSCVEIDKSLTEPHQSLDPDKMKLWGRAAAIRAHLLSYQGDVQSAVQRARQALEYLPKSDATWRSTAYDCIGTVYNATGDVVSAYRARLEALEESKAAGNAYMILFASLRLVVTLRDLGHLQRAIEICQQQLKLANEGGLSQTALVGWLFALWGEILAEKNELDSALQLANKGIILTERGNDVILLVSSYWCLMRVLISRDDLDKASAIIQKVYDLTPKQDLALLIRVQMEAWQARIWVAQGRLDLASQWAEKCEFDVDGELSHLHDFDYVVFARLLIAQGRLDETSRLLQRLFEAAEARGRTSKSIEVLVLQALAHQEADDSTQAMDALESALALAEPGGFVRSFVDEGPPMARLLREAARRAAVADYARRLLAVFRAADEKQLDPSKAQSAGSALIEPLSERETEVLELIAEGLTNPDIAARLFLSLNTVKAHTRSIYGKLEVHSRTQAVARSQELGLLALR